MSYREDLLKFAPADYDVNKIGFVIINNKQSTDSMDIDFELTPIPVTSNETVWTCRVCNKAYMTRSNLNRHLTVHTRTPDAYNCHICKFDLKTQRALTYQMKTHFKQQQTILKEELTCDICGRVESSRESMIMHLDMHMSLNIVIEDIFE